MASYGRPAMPSRQMGKAYRRTKGRMRNRIFRPVFSKKFFLRFLKIIWLSAAETQLPVPSCEIGSILNMHLAFKKLFQFTVLICAKVSNLSRTHVRLICLCYLQTKIRLFFIAMKSKQYHVIVYMRNRFCFSCRENIKVQLVKQARYM